MTSPEILKKEIKEKISNALKLLNEANDLVVKDNYSHIDAYEKVDDTYNYLRETLHLLEDLRETGRSK